MIDTNRSERSCSHTSRRNGQDESENVGGKHYEVLWVDDVRRGVFETVLKEDVESVVRKKYTLLK